MPISYRVRYDGQVIPSSKWKPRLLSTELRHPDDRTYVVLDIQCDDRNPHYHLLRLLMLSGLVDNPLTIPQRVVPIDLDPNTRLP